MVASCFPLVLLPLRAQRVFPREPPLANIDGNHLPTVQRNTCMLIQNIEIINPWAGGKKNSGLTILGMAQVCERALHQISLVMALLNPAQSDIRFIPSPDRSPTPTTTVDEAYIMWPESASRQLLRLAVSTYLTHVSIWGCLG